MRILGLNVSPNGKRSQTKRLVDAVLAGAAERGAATEYVDLTKLRIEYCIGCRKCFDTGACFHKDDYQALLDKMLASDGLVWGSPNHSFCVRAQMKALIDRMADVIHCQSFAGKYCCAVATGGRDDKVITAYLRTNFLDFGAWVTGTAGAVVTQGPAAVDRAEVTARALGLALVDDIASRRPYFDQQQDIDRNRREFQDKIKANRDAWRHQYAYWEALGWP